MIRITNRVKAIKVDTAALKKDAQRVLGHLGYSDYDLGILLTTNATIRRFNREYRNKDKATDVLSFPFFPKLKPGERIRAHEPDEKNLGDLIISLEYVKKDAPRWGHTFKERMRILLVHGICHLLGYDHQTDTEYKEMKQREDELLRLLV